MTGVRSKVLIGTLLLAVAGPLGGCVVLPSEGDEYYAGGSGPNYYNYDPPPYYQKRVDDDGVTKR